MARQLISSNDLAALIQALKPGDTATLSVQKKGADSPSDVKVTLGDDPNKAGQAYLGLKYRLGPGSVLPKDVVPQAGPGLKLNGQAGVLVSSVAAGSPAAKAGLKTRDLITAVNGKAVTTPDELTSLVKAAKAGDKLDPDGYAGRRAKSVSGGCHIRGEPG